MKTFLPRLAAATAIAFATPAIAQTMDPSAMPGMAMPAQPAAVDDPDCPPEHAEMGHCTPSAPAAAPVQPDPHARHDMAGKTEMPGHGTGGTALPAGNGPAPAAPKADYADRIWGAAAMKPVRDAMHAEHGGGSFSQIMVDLAEYRMHRGRDGFHWDGEGWFGGDINRLVIKSEGSITMGDGVESAEIQALYSRAIGPYFNLQAGIRHDLKPSPSRTYATIGFEGLAPYWFEVEGALFLSDKGDVLARLGGYYDQRITQRLILQPRAEFNLAAQDVPETGIGSGLSDIELGLRLRYEIAREFAPYVGVSWDRKVGDTARYARLAGEDASSVSLVLGVRAWF